MSDPPLRSEPLSGVRIAVTRPGGQAEALAAALEASGASVVRCPLVRIEPPADAAALRAAIARIHEFDMIVFTSANAVRRLCDALAANGARIAQHTVIAVVGRATAEAAAVFGIAAALVPEDATAEALAEAIATTTDVRDRSILFPRASAAGRLLPQRLRELGARLEEVECYRTAPEPAAAARLAALVRAGGLDAIAFTSPSQVAAFADAVSAATADGPIIAAIGPVTAEAAAQRGLRVEIVAREHTAAGLVDAICAHYTPRCAAPSGARPRRTTE